MFTKTFVVALIVATAALAASANAGPAKQPTQGATQENSWMDRASQNYDGGGY